MTPEKRKNLVINKNTLFYMKKNLKDGKNIKIYNKILTKLDTKLFLDCNYEMILIKYLIKSRHKIDNYNLNYRY